MTFDEIFKIVDQIFSEDGFSVKGLKVKFDKDTDINIKKNDTSIVISFPKNEPVISIKKIISFSVRLSGLHLSDKGGVLELDNFPDIPFTYEQIS
tara:strand:+ start:129 stop:413 length:285 start_codon:yes stop_codon:yes gene_type:complete